MRKLSTHPLLIRGLIVLALSFTLLGVSTKAMELETEAALMCGTIEQERSCEKEARAAWDKAVEGYADYNPIRLYYAVVYTDRINQCYAPCGGSIL